MLRAGVKCTMPLGDCQVLAEIVLYKVVPGFWLSSTLNLTGAVVGPALS